MPLFYPIITCLDPDPIRIQIHNTVLKYTGRYIRRRKWYRRLSWSLNQHLNWDISNSSLCTSLLPLRMFVCVLVSQFPQVWFWIGSQFPPWRSCGFAAALKKFFPKVSVIISEKLHNFPEYSYKNSDCILKHQQFITLCSEIKIIFWTVRPFW